MSSDIELLLDHYSVEYDGSKTREQPIVCPVHSERRASASLNLEKELFHCLACGVGGSVYDLVMARESLSYVKARARVEEITGRRTARMVEKNAKMAKPGEGYRARSRIKRRGRMARPEW